MNTTPRYYLKPAAIKPDMDKHIQANDAKRKLRDMRILIAAFVKAAA